MIRRAFLTLSLVVGLLCASQAQIMMLFSSDSLTNITSPLDLDSLFYWFAADQGVTDSLGGAIATDEGVGTWNDLSGNGYHVTQTTNGARPVYKATGGPGSKPCIQFDGSNDFLASAAHWWGSDDLTIFVVMKFGNATRNTVEAVVTKGESTDNKRQWTLIGSLNPYPFRLELRKDGTTTNQVILAGAAKSATYKLVHYQSAPPSTASHFVDGVSSAITATVSGTGDYTIYDGNTYGVCIGAVNPSSTPVQFLQGSISEIIVYSRALSATERAAIENYLNKKYDLY